MKNIITKLTKDLLSISILSLFSAFLIHSYFGKDYLNTGYPDWIYQAFRVQNIIDYGILSWDNIWANGSNYWLMYQYIPHLIAASVSENFKLPASSSILYVSASAFVGIRIVLYICLRNIGVRPLISFMAVLVSLTLSQQWLAIKEFSIFVAAILVPILVLLTKKSTERHDVFAFVSPFALAGIFWSIHPVLGLVSTAFVAWNFLFNLKFHKKFKNIALVVLVFILSWIPFAYQYALSRGQFSNPFFTTSQFANIALPYPYLGLSLAVVIFLALSLLVSFFAPRKVSKFGVSTVIFGVVFVAFVLMAQNSYLPSFLVGTQFYRGMFFVGLITTMGIALIFQSVVGLAFNKILLSVVAVIVASLMASSIEVASQTMALPTNNLQSPISLAFANRAPVGTVFYENVSEASFIAPWLRQAGSYNTHLLPSPISFRFTNLITQEIAGGTVSGRQAQLIDDYARVMGVEYFLVPQGSVLTTFPQRPSIGSNYKIDAEIISGDLAFQLVRRIEPPHFGYIAEREVFNRLNSKTLSNPTVQVKTYAAWDEVIGMYSEAIKSGELKPIPVRFPAKNRLSADIVASGFSDPVVLIMQSWDRNWSLVNSNVSVSKTNLGYIALSDVNSVSQVNMVNNWPNYHWPVMTSGFIASSIFLILGQVIGRKVNKEE